MSGSNQAAPIGPTIAILPPLPQSDAPSVSENNNDISNSSSAASMQQQQTPTSQQQSMQQSPRPSMQQQQQSPNPGGMPNPDTSSARLSSQWSPDSQSHYCSACQAPFDAFFNRRHHCRLCGLLFCHNCSNTRSLIPPSALVLKASGGSNAGSMSGPWLDPRTGQRVMLPAPSSNVEGDSSITYVSSTNATTSNLTTNDDTLLYGKGLEQRILLARHPQRVCHSCSTQLAPIQNELCLRNSNAMRYNYIDEGDALRRLCNSPLAFTLGHEVRKAAYTLGNLLPGKKVGRSGAFAPTSSSTNNAYTSYPPPEADPFDGCKTIDPTLRNIDKLHIPAKLLQQAKGVAIITSCKGGLGFAGFEFGTGLVVARRNDGSSLDDWTAPCAIGAYSIAWGALVGAQLSDHVFLLMTDDAVRLFSSEKGKSIQLGADVGVALGPLGRSAEADIGATPGMSRSLDGSYSRNSNGVAMAPIYTYSLSKGLYAGVSLDGRILITRDRVNEKFYGRSVTAHELLSGQVPTPPAAQPLYDALRRCRIYGGGGGHQSASLSNIPGAIPRDSSGGGYFMEALSNTTGAGLPISSTNSARFSSPNPYNLEGRELPNLTPGYD